jgi:hypothetical protein
VTLSGGSRDELVLVEITLADVAAVRIGRRPHERIGGRPTLVVELRDGRTVSLVGFGTIGTLRELADRLWELTGAPPEPEPVG